MKSLLACIFFGIVFFGCSSCGNTKELIPLTPDQIKNFHCHANIVQYQVKGRKNETYADIRFKLQKGKLKQNWKIDSCYVNGVSYPTFFNTSFIGKNQRVYINSVRNLPDTLKYPINVIIKMESESQQSARFDLKNVRKRVVR